MNPNNLGNYLTVEGCRKIRLKDVLAETKRQMKASLADVVIEEEGQSISLALTKTNFRGKRLWLVWSNCGSKRSFFYQHSISRPLKCRKCMGNIYKEHRYN